MRIPYMTFAILAVLAHSTTAGEQDTPTWWSLRPLNTSPPPSITTASPGANPIDAFILKRLADAGAVILPAMPGFYNSPRSVDDLVNFVVARICDQLEIKHQLSHRWGSDS